MKRRMIPALLLAACGLVSPAAAGPDFPLLFYGNESVATTDGATGFLFNSAAGGIRYPSEFATSWRDFGNGRTFYQGALAWPGGGIAGSHLDDDGERYTLAASGGRDPLRIGTTMHLLRGLSSDRRATDWSAGALSRPVPWLSLGAVADHVTRPAFAGGRLEREYTLGIGLRPLALAPVRAHDAGTRFTLTADVRMRENADPARARVRVGGEIELVRGLVLRGAIEDHGGYHVGLALLGPRHGYHAQSAFERGGDRLYTTYSVSVHEGEDRGVPVGRSNHRVALLRLRGDLSDEALPGWSLLGGGGGTPVAPIHRQLARALEDPLTRGVFLDLRGISNLAQIEELRPRIRRLRDAGKPVVAYLEEGGGRGDLYLASACDRIVTTPEALFVALGLRAERRYYRRLLAGWGVRFDRASYGEYKSAFRSLSVDSTTAADREVIENLLDRLQDLFVSGVSADRGMPRERLLALLDGRAWPPRELARAGLVDSIGHREDAMRILGRLCGLGDKPRTVKLESVPPARREWTRRAPVAVVYASGGIDLGESGNDLLLGPYMGSETLARQLERAFTRRGVRAVVLRVESPGGSATASELIFHATQRMKRETRKPLVVSMGGVAASGGYYISAGGDRVFADRFTRTGSIGVVFVKPSLEGWYARRGVRQDAFDRGDFMYGSSLGRDWDARAQAAADSAVMDTYREFVAAVAGGRGMAWEDVDRAARGRVWMGDEARGHGLVDAIGGLEEAIAEARRRAGVPEGERIDLIEYRRPRPGLLERYVGALLSRTWERNAHLPDPGAAYLWDDAGL